MRPPERIIHTVISRTHTMHCIGAYINPRVGNPIRLQPDIHYQLLYQTPCTQLRHIPSGVIKVTQGPLAAFSRVYIQQPTGVELNTEK